MTLKDFLSEIINLGINITPITKGKCLEYYQVHKYGEFAQDVKIEDDDGDQRTIHKAKGDEAINVLVITGGKYTPETLLKYDLYKEESHRVYYVAMSRARDRLFIQFSHISTEAEEFFRKEWNIEVIHLS